MITLLASGQSNMVGRGGGGVYEFGPRVTVWNNANDRDDLTNLGDQFVSPDLNQNPFVNGKNNLAIHAANYIAKHYNCDVRLILVAKGSQPIDQWLGGGPMYVRMKAILAAAVVGKVDGFLWHQGESDQQSPDDYPGKWNELKSALSLDSVIDETTPIIIGELSVTSSPMNTVIHSLANPRTVIARISNLQTKDGEHFTGASLASIGWHYAWAINELEDFWKKDEVKPMDYVSAHAAGALTFLSGQDTPVPLIAKHGRAELIVDGCFVASKSGVWIFSATGHAGANKLRVKLLDETGAELAFLAYSGSSDPSGNNPIISGSDTLNLSRGDKVRLGLTQESGATTSLSAGLAAAWCRLHVEYKGSE